MFPIILEIGPIKIYSFGLMLVIAFYTCYFLLYSEMKRLKYDTEIASDIIFWAAVGGVLGAKIYYLIENLDRTLSDKRIYPSIDVDRSGTRREDKLIGKKDLSRIWLLRKMLSDMTSVEAMEFLLGKLSRTKHNREFLDSMSN